MTRRENLSGIIDTALQPDDDDPGFDKDGYTSLLNYETDDASEENEDDPAFEGLLEEGLSQQEAQAAVDFMKPVSDEEAEILNSIPLQGLSKVDDSEHQQWLAERVKDGKKGIDRVFEDAIYGDHNMNHNEEKMERTDRDSAKGWGFKSIKRGLRRAGRLATAPVRKLGSVAMRFVPNRDARKAALVRNTYKKLWFEHANWLAIQDKNAGAPLKTRAQYEYIAKLWARDQLKQNKLPTSFIPADTATSTSGSARVLQKEILGEGTMGSWWWPFGTFLNLSRTTINNTADQRADAPPDEQQAQAVPPGYQDVSAVQAPQQDVGPDPADDSQGDTAMKRVGWNGFIRMRGLDSVLGGEDSLGAYATQILGATVPQPAKDNPHVEKIVKLIAMKLQAGKPISPGEIGLLSSAAKEGNVNAQKIILALKKGGAVVSGDASGMDPWLYKLSPSYWLSSKQKREFTDIEKKKWVENAALSKQLAKQKEDLDAAEHAAQAAQAVETAKAQSAATEKQLREIAASLKGEMSGSFIGHEKITPISQVVVNALAKAGKKEEAGKLYAKIKDGQALDQDELKSARQIAKIVGRMKVVHGDLIDPENEALTMHGAFVGACVLGAIDSALQKNKIDHQIAQNLSAKIASGKTIAQPERQLLGKVLQNQKKLHSLTTSLTSGQAFVGCKQKKTWTKGAFVGAVKAMSEQDKKMLAAIVKLAKIGNPRAQKALAALKKSGEISGGDFIGLSFGTAFKYATAPVWLPAYGAYKGTKWTGQKLGIIKKRGSSPEQQRLSMLRAAAARRRAAEARAAAADAQSEAEQRAQAAIADAADAEADAADAEALAKEQAMKTKEVEADPSTAVTEGNVGEWIDLAGKDTKDAKLIAKANEKSAAGIKIRAGNQLFRRAKKGDPKARQAIETMVKKAKAGDQQALRDVNAIKAGRAYQKAVARAQRKKAVLAARQARKQRVVAMQKKFEARTAEKLIRISRKHELHKNWKVERMAARGNPKAKAYVAKQVALSKKGDKKAQARVLAMRQGRMIRQKVKTPREARNMRQAEAFVKRLKRNDPKTLRQYEVMKAAANKGNPNAIRAIDRIMLAAMVVGTVETGVVIASRQKKTKSSRKQAEKTLAMAKKKAVAGTGYREELAAGAKAAHDLGDEKTAGQLANLASQAPSATESVKKKAATLAAAEAGNPEAKAELASNLEAAKKGDAQGVKEIGKVLAVDTVDKVSKGQPISPTMQDAINMNERIKAGDPNAIAQAKEITTQASSENPSPEATLAAGGLVAAGLVDKSLAAKPKAKRELMDKANPPMPTEERTAAEAEVATIMAKTNDGTVTPEEGQRGIDLAIKLGQPKIAAMISAKAPPAEITPMSSLPDMPLTPITGLRQLLGESVKALVLATRDPIANYRGGIANRSRTLVQDVPVSAAGWSPFDSFKKALPGVALASMPVMALASMPVMAATSVANLLKKPKEQKVNVVVTQPIAAAAPATPALPAVAPSSKTPASTAGAFVGRAEIAGDDFRAIIANALQSRKMSKADFNRAVNASAGPNSPQFAKQAAAEQVLKFLTDRKVKVD